MRIGGGQIIGDTTSLWHGSEMASSTKETRFLSMINHRGNDENQCQPETLPFIPPVSAPCGVLNKG